METIIKFLKSYGHIQQNYRHLICKSRINLFVMIPFNSNESKRFFNVTSFFDDHIINTFLAGFHTELGIQRNLFSVKSVPKIF